MAAMHCQSPQKYPRHSQKREEDCQAQSSNKCDACLVLAVQRSTNWQCRHDFHRSPALGHSPGWQENTHWTKLTHPPGWGNDNATFVQVMLCHSSSLRNAGFDTCFYWEGEKKSPFFLASQYKWECTLYRTGESKEQVPTINKDMRHQSFANYLQTQNKGFRRGLCARSISGLNTSSEV